MANLLYLIAGVLVVAWLVGFLAYAAGGLIHLLLILAVIAILLIIVTGSRRRI